MAVAEKIGVITTYHNLSAGTIAAGYQNFIICIEMFFAAISLHFAFPYKTYLRQRKLDERGQGIALKRISKNLRQTINPKDIVDDAIHNFSRTYQQYANANNTRTYNEDTCVANANPYRSYDSTIVDSFRPGGMQVTVIDGRGHTLDEKATLLDSDDDF